MKRIQTYQKGDPEYLIIQKQYHELRDDERAALAEWVQSQEDYDRIRRVLLELHDDQEEWLEPDASIKKNLMRKFASEEKGGRLIWLNSVLFAPGEPLFKQPILRYGLAAACVMGLAVFFLSPDTKQPEIAQQAETSNNASSSEWTAAAADSVADADTLRVFAEVKPEMPMVPPAAVELGEVRDLTEEPRMASAPEASSEARVAMRDSDLSDAPVEMNDKESVPSDVAVSSVPAKKQVASAMPAPVATPTSVDMSVSLAETKRLLDDLYTAR